MKHWHRSVEPLRMPHHWKHMWCWHCCLCPPLLADCCFYAHLIALPPPCQLTQLPSPPLLAPPLVMASRLRSKSPSVAMNPPRLQPPITNQPKLKLPLSIRLTPTAQCCFPGSIIPLWHPPLLHIALLVTRRGGCKEGTNTAGKATLSGEGPSDG